MSYSAVDVDWCLTCQKHLDISGKGYCSQCEPSPSQLLRLGPLDDSEDSDGLGDEDCIFHQVEDTSIAKGIAAWAANVPAGAPSSCYDLSSAMPKLLRPQSSRPVPPALSMSESTSASIPVATPPSAPKNISMFSSFASHVRSFVSSSAGFHVDKSRPRTKNRLHNLSSSIHQRHRPIASSSYDSSEEEVEHDVRPTLSPLEDTEDLWWVTDSDYSSTSSSPVIKKSSAQLIASPTNRQHDLDCEIFFQPKVLPIPDELSSRLSKLDWDDEDDEDIKMQQAWRSRGRQVR